MTDITIPPEALEAAARVMHANLELFEDLPWEDLSDADQEEYLAQARATIAAAINAWPGMHEAKSDRLNCQIIILPLPKENTND